MTFHRVYLGNGNENNCGDQHCPSKKQVILRTIKFTGTVCIKNKEINEAGEEIANCNRGHEETEHKRLHHPGSLGVRKLQAGNRNHHLRSEVRSKYESNCQPMPGVSPNPIRYSSQAGIRKDGTTRKNNQSLSCGEV